MRQISNVGWLAFLVAVVACGAPSSSSTRAAEPVSGPQRAPDAGELVARAIETTRTADPRDALAILDEAERAAPSDPRVWLARGNACLAAAERDPQGGLYFADARAAFERAVALGAGAEALFGASRAARMGLDGGAALDFARRGLAEAPLVEPEQLRIAIEACFDAYVAHKQAGEDAAELFAETEAHLLDSAFADAGRAWTLAQLANLYQWEGKADSACEVLATLVDVAPDDESAHERLTGALRARGGRAEVLAFCESFHARHAGNALGAWYLAREVFEAALEDLLAGRDSSASFARAEELFRGCRAANEAYRQNCQGYEVICRSGVGWCRFNAGDTDAAERAFLSMEELFAGGMEWQIEGRLPSGVVGMQFVADRAVRGAPDENDIEGNAKAAEIYARLHAYRPNDAEMANNCGFFHREAGVASAMAANAARERAARESEAPARAKLEQRARELDRQARAMLHTCRDAYLEAARLVSENVRVVNDAALILVYHFPSLAGDAERLLKRAAELGEAQKDDPGITDEARDLLIEAWGDAYQNLGLLELQRGRPAEAKAYYEKCFEIGPRPRVDRAWIRSIAIPFCDQALAGEPIDVRSLDPRVFSVE